MSRFVDYFVICGFDHTKGRPESSSQVIQRFPEKDWPDVPFIQGIDLFCQPNGWKLSTQRQDPTFFMSVLTTVEGTRLYCPCLSFSEVENSGSGMDYSVMFAPKCLVLLSRHDMAEAFRSCLKLLYTAYTEGMTGGGDEPSKLETLVGNLLGKVTMPSPGSASLKFSLGGSDQHTIQPPTFPDLPMPGSRVALLFQQLGINSVLTLFSAVLAEQKILFYSSSFSRLTDSCMALTSLIYPMLYTHTLIPILPLSLLEYLSSPTPYIIGVHSIHQEQMDEILDVITVDLDRCKLTIPENMSIHQIMEPLRTNVANELSLVLHPDLHLADNAFQSDLISKSSVVLDKELRAVMLRLMTQLLEGYRSCLTLVRVHPQPIVTFQKAKFFRQRNFPKECDFIHGFFDCMFFNDFIDQRCSPWRKCDIFDELCVNIGGQIALELLDPHETLMNIENLAKELDGRHENCCPPHEQNCSKKVPLPTKASKKVLQSIFPTLDTSLVTRLIEDSQRLKTLPAEQTKQNFSPFKLVPMGPTLLDGSTSHTLVASSDLGLDVLRKCISNIFEHKIFDALRNLSSVIMALESQPARLAMCVELERQRAGGQNMVDQDQFTLIVMLMNTALQDSADVDMHRVAAALLPLATTFGRKLCPGVIQYVCTQLKDHPVWHDMQFWEAAFFTEVQKKILKLYLENWDEQESSALEIAAKEIKEMSKLSEATVKERVDVEEQTVCGQAIHFTTMMISVLLPMDSDPDRASKAIADHSKRKTSSVADSDPIDSNNNAESSLDDAELDSDGTNVIKFVSRFVSKVCAESSVSEHHLESLKQKVPELVAMHLETMEAVSREAKQLSHSPN